MIDLDAEEVDLSTAGSSSSDALHRAALEEDGIDLSNVKRRRRYRRPEPTTRP